MTMEEKLVEYLKDNAPNDIPRTDFEVMETLEEFSRGRFYVLFTDKDIEKFGGKKNLQNLSITILNNLS